MIELLMRGGRLRLLAMAGFALVPASNTESLANGQPSIKSEAVRRIVRELPRWQWTWLFHFVPRVIRDAIYDLVARNRPMLAPCSTLSLLLV
jgi:predicted DCC family thiol-disulfide oxidoreductase YuxK